MDGDNAPSFPYCAAMINFPFRRLAIDCMYTQVLNLVCGLITTYVFKFSGGFLSNWRR